MEGKAPFRREFEAFRGEEKAAPSNKVFVSNLPFDLRPEALIEHCKPAGSVTNVNILKTREGTSKGSALVQFESEEQAKNAVRILNDTEVSGRKIFVREDRPLAAAGVGRGKPVKKNFAPRALRDNRVSASIRARAPGECQVFVGNLPWVMTWQELKDVCSQHGKVIRADINHDRVSNRSRGTGIVVFASEADAKKTIEALNDTEYKGRKLLLRLDQFANTEPGAKLFVGNLPFSTTWQELKDLFSEFGEVTRADVVQDANGRSKGFGTVIYASRASADAAIAALHDKDYKTRNLQVRHDAFSLPADLAQAEKDGAAAPAAVPNGSN